MTRIVQMPFCYRSSRGATMVELLIAMVLALLLSVAMVQLFVSNRQAFNILESTSRLQENGRFAMEFITRELRAAGYSGCLRDDTLINNVLDDRTADDKPRPMWNFSLPVLGFDTDSEASTWDPALESSDYTNFSFPNAEAGSDILVVHTSEVLPVKGFQAGNVMSGSVGEANVTTNANSGLNQNDIVFVTDCSRGAIFRVTNSTPALSIAHEDNTVVPPVTKTMSSGHVVVRYPGNRIKALGHVYGQNSGVGGAGPAEISRLRTISFYIKNDANGRPALYRKVFNETPKELVKGVEDIQILYGVASDPNEWGTVTQYVTAKEVNDAGDWDKVAAVRIHLLLQSEDNATDAPVPYTFNGVTVDPDDADSGHPGDRRIRREFVTTIGIRNQIL